MKVMLDYVGFCWVILGFGGDKMVTPNNDALGTWYV